MKKLLIPIAIFLAIPFNSHADCIACSELKGITLILNSGKKIEGYIRWNSIWPYNNSDNYPIDTFPINVINYHKREDLKLFTFRAIYFLTDLFPGIPFVLQTDIDSTNANDIKEILYTPGEYDGIDSTPLQQVTAEKYALLKKKPVAKFCGSLEVPAAVCLVSYNSDYAESKLQEIVAKNKFWTMIEELEMKSVFVFDFAYD
jgi:hypothetical protein